MFPLPGAGVRNLLEAAISMKHKLSDPGAGVGKVLEAVNYNEKLISTHQRRGRKSPVGYKLQWKIRFPTPAPGSETSWRL